MERRRLFPSPHDRGRKNDSRERESSGASGNGRQNDIVRRTMQEAHIKEKDTAKNLNKRKEEIKTYVKGIRNHSNKLADDRMQMYRQIQRLLDDSPRYDQLDPQEKKAFDARLQHYDRARELYNTRAEEINELIDLSRRDIADYNTGVYIHMDSLTDKNHRVRILKNRNLPRQVTPFSDFQTFQDYNDHIAYLLAQDNPDNPELQEQLARLFLQDNPGTTDAHPHHSSQEDN